MQARSVLVVKEILEEYMMELGFVNENRTQDAEVQYSGVHDLGLEDFRFDDSGLEISVNNNSQLEKYGLQDSGQDTVDQETVFADTGYRTQDTVDQGTVFEDSGYRTQDTAAQETVFTDTGYRTQDTAAQETVVQLMYQCDYCFRIFNHSQARNRHSKGKIHI